MKQIIDTNLAPAAIGPYSQAVQVDNTVYLSGQIPLNPLTMELVSNDIEEQIHQVFRNLSAVCAAAGGGINSIVKLNIYLKDLNNFSTINEIMSTYFDEPYPARAAIEISDLPKGSQVEVDGILTL